MRIEQETVRVIKVNEDQEYSSIDGICLTLNEFLFMNTFYHIGTIQVISHNRNSIGYNNNKYFNRLLSAWSVKESLNLLRNISLSSWKDLTTNNRRKKTGKFRGIMSISVIFCIFSAMPWSFFYWYIRIVSMLFIGIWIREIPLSHICHANIESVFFHCVSFFSIFKAFNYRMFVTIWSPAFHHKYFSFRWIEHQFLYFILLYLPTISKKKIRSIVLAKRKEFL